MTINRNRIGLIALLITTILLTSCLLQIPFLTPTPTPDTDQKPVAPGNLRITPENAQITLNWDAVDNVESYSVYRGGERIGTTTGTTYTDTGLTNGVTYRYTVRALGNNGLESPHSTEVTTTLGTRPHPPGNLRIEAIIGSVTLHWYASPNVASYRIYRNGSPHDMALPPNRFVTYTYIDNTVTNGVTYRYTVRALGNNGLESLPSLEVSATPPSTVDFDTLANSGNDAPRGIWSDGTTMWVSDDRDLKVYAYELNDESRDAAKDFDIPFFGSLFLRSMWSNDTTIWLPNVLDGKLYAYDLLTWTRVPTQDFNTRGEDFYLPPGAIWSDNTTMWVLSQADEIIYAYDMTSKERDMGKDITILTASGNAKPQGMTAHGGTMWVSDTDNNKLYAYDIASRTRAPTQDFDTLDTARNNTPVSIWTDGTTMWVLDYDDKKIYAYDMASKELIP